MRNNHSKNGFKMYALLIISSFLLLTEQGLPQDLKNVPENETTDTLQIYPQNKNLLRLGSGEKLQLHAFLNQVGKTHLGEWTSANPQIINVGKQGLLEAGQETGTAVIKFSTKTSNNAPIESNITVINLGNALSLYFKKPDNWNRSYAYAFDDQGNQLFDNWPGKAMISDIEYGGNWYKSHLLEPETLINRNIQLVFHSGDGDQTRDLQLKKIDNVGAFFHLDGQIDNPPEIEPSFQGTQLQTSGARAYLNPGKQENLSGLLFKPYQIIEIEAREAAPGEAFSHFEGTASSWLIDPTKPKTRLMMGEETSYALFAVFVPIEDEHREARRLYRNLCVSCHGLDGSGPTPLTQTPEILTENQIEKIIEAQMPIGSPEVCSSDCAKKITQLILEQAFSEPRGSCGPQEKPEASELLERNLRLLTKSEYINSIEEILKIDRTEEVAKNLPDEIKTAGFFTGSDTLATPERMKLYFMASRVAAEIVPDLVEFYPQCSSQKENKVEPEKCRISKLARRLYRRPLTDMEITNLLNTYKSLGFKPLIMTMLNAPDFLYRSELGVADNPDLPNQFRLTAFELATWLSYTFIGKPPSDELLDLAEQGQLDTDKALVAAAEKLLKNDEAKAKFRQFTKGWLKIGTLASVDTTSSLKSSMIEESYKFVEETIFSDKGKLSDLLLGKHTFLDATLAEHYGVEKPTDTQWSKVPYEGNLTDRKGIFGHARLFASGSATTKTHPVKRGLFVRNQLLCQEFPPPPVGAELKPSHDDSATTRERFEILHNKPECQSCHQFIDGIGFGLESYGPDGLKRSHELVDNGSLRLVDASGYIGSLQSPETVLSTTEPTVNFSGITELAELVNSSPNAKSCFVRQFFRYSIGRKEKPVDQCNLYHAGAQFKYHDQSILGLMQHFATMNRFRTRKEKILGGAGNARP